MRHEYFLDVRPCDSSVLRGPVPSTPMRVVAEPTIGESLVLVSTDRRFVVRTSRVLGFLGTEDRMVLRTENSLYSLTRVREPSTVGFVA